jgi:hypothetical protein
VIAPLFIDGKFAGPLGPQFRKPRSDRDLIEGAGEAGSDGDWLFAAIWGGEIGYYGLRIVLN